MTHPGFPGLQPRVPLPEPGDVFAVAVAPGVEAVLRVVDETPDARCVVMTRVQGAPRRSVPRLRGLREVQPLAHHERRRPLLGAWVREAPPDEVRRLGHAAVEATERARVLHPAAWVKQAVKTAADAQRVLPLMRWDALLQEVRLQWRWDHARAAVEREDAAREHASQRLLAAALSRGARAEERLVEQGVKALAGRRFFAAWRREVPPEVIREAEALLAGAVERVDGRSPAVAARKLASVVRGFNRLARRHPFEATHREDLLDAVRRVARACAVDEDALAAVERLLEG